MMADDNTNLSLENFKDYMPVLEHLKNKGIISENQEKEYLAAWQAHLKEAAGETKLLSYLEDRGIKRVLADQCELVLREQGLVADVYGSFQRTEDYSDCKLYLPEEILTGVVVEYIMSNRIDLNELLMIENPEVLAAFLEESIKGTPITAISAAKFTNVANFRRYVDYRMRNSTNMKDESIIFLAKMDEEKSQIILSAGYLANIQKTGNFNLTNIAKINNPILKLMLNSECGREAICSKIIKPDMINEINNIVPEVWEALLTAEGLTFLENQEETLARLKIASLFNTKEDLATFIACTAQNHVIDIKAIIKLADNITTRFFANDMDKPDISHENILRFLSLLGKFGMLFLCLTTMGRMSRTLSNSKDYWIIEDTSKFFNLEYPRQTILFHRDDLNKLADLIDSLAYVQDSTSALTPGELKDILFGLNNLIKKTTPNADDLMKISPLYINKYPILEGKNFLESFFAGADSWRRAKENLFLAELFIIKTIENMPTEKQKNFPRYNLNGWIELNLAGNPQGVFASLSPNYAKDILDNGDENNIALYKDSIDMLILNTIRQILAQPTAKERLRLFEKFLNRLATCNSRVFKSNSLVNLGFIMCEHAQENDEIYSWLSVVLKYPFTDLLLQVIIREIIDSAPDNDSSKGKHYEKIIIALMDSDDKVGAPNCFTSLFNFIFTDLPLDEWYNNSEVSTMLRYYHKLLELYLLPHISTHINYDLVETHLNIFSAYLQEVATDPNLLIKNKLEFQMIFDTLIELSSPDTLACIASDDFLEHFRFVYEKFSAVNPPLKEEQHFDRDDNITKIFADPNLFKIFRPSLTHLATKEKENIPQRIRLALNDKDYDLALILFDAGFSLPCVHLKRNTIAEDKPCEEARRAYSQYVVNLLMEGIGKGNRKEKNSQLISYLIKSGATTTFAIDYNDGKQYPPQEASWRKEHQGYTLLHFAIRYNDINLFNRLETEGVITELTSREAERPELKIANFASNYKDNDVRKRLAEISGSSTTTSSSSSFFSRASNWFASSSSSTEPASSTSPRMNYGASDDEGL